MADYNAEHAGQLNKEETARLVIDLFHRIILHHGMWYGEVKHQMGTEKALVLLEQAFKASFGIQMSHGCINMRNEEAKWLFCWCTPVFETPIESEYDWERRGNGTQVEVY